jgi:hypothetical protein
MDRYFIARQQHSKIKLVIPNDADVEKYSEQQQDPVDYALEKKAELCERIAKSRGVKPGDVPEFVKRHRLMSRSIEELSVMYPGMWKSHKVNQADF